MREQTVLPTCLNELPSSGQSRSQTSSPRRRIAGYRRVLCILAGLCAYVFTPFTAVAQVTDTPDSIQVESSDADNYASEVRRLMQMRFQGQIRRPPVTQQPLPHQAHPQQLFLTPIRPQHSTSHSAVPIKTPDSGYPITGAPTVGKQAVGKQALEKQTVELQAAGKLPTGTRQANSPLGTDAAMQLYLQSSGRTAQPSETHHSAAQSIDQHFRPRRESKPSAHAAGSSVPTALNAVPSPAHTNGLSPSLNGTQSRLPFHTVAGPQTPTWVQPTHQRWLTPNASAPAVTAQQTAFQSLLDEDDDLLLGADNLRTHSKSQAAASANRYGEDLLSDDLLGDNRQDVDISESDLLGGAADDGSEDDPLGNMGPDDAIPGSGHGKDKPSRGGVPEGEDPHKDVFADNCYPSATACAKCHQKIYDEWRVSAHAYAAISPMFQKFEQAISQLSQGTIGYFCMRCHAPVATQMNFDRATSIVDAPYIYREGVTCVACHRVKERYGRVHGERRIEPGPLQAPVYGGVGGSGVAKAIAEKDTYKIKLDPNSDKPGQEIHWQGIKFEQLGDSGFCQPCHQVAVHPGISLEVVWAQYRAGPACKKGISCQDCHMGLVPGKPYGYSYGAAAEMNGLSVNNQRKHSNHIFFGPGNSIAHPGLFPHNEKSLRWSIDQWLLFNWRGGWGTDAFEKAVAKKQIVVNFPDDWDSSDERRDARKVLDENLKLLEVKKASSIQVMEVGSRVEGPFFRENKTPRLGQDLHFKYRVSNISEGHNNPSGSLGAQPQLWLNVVLTGPDGRWLWESGYLDGNGDLANQHSLQVRKGMIPPDRQLFNLQTQFLTTGVKGTDREMYLPVNVDIDQLPFLRPGNIPVSVMNHPPFIRMEQKSIPPLGHKWAKYSVPGHLLCQPGNYKLTVRMRSRMEPIYFMRFVKATPEMERRMLEQTIDLHPYTVEFNVQ